MYTSGAVMTVDNRAQSGPISIFFYPSAHRDASDPYQPYASDAAITVYISLDTYPDPLHRVFDAKVTSDASGLAYFEISGQSVPALENGTYNIIMTEAVANPNCSTIRYYYVGYCRGVGCTVQDPSGYTTQTTGSITYLQGSTGLASHISGAKPTTRRYTIGDVFSFIVVIILYVFFTCIVEQEDCS
jgi:hypothetical protein